MTDPKPVREIRARLEAVESDARLWYAPATTDVNAPLALVQVHLKATSDALRWVLNMRSRPQRRTKRSTP